MKILIVKYSSLGDIVQALPMAALIKEEDPQAHITWVVEENYARLLDNHPYVDTIISFAKSSGSFFQTVKSVRAVMQRIKQERFDRVYDPQGLFLSGLFVWSSRAQERIGFLAAREFAPWAYTRRVSFESQDINAAERYAFLVTGKKDNSFAFGLEVSEEDRSAIRHWLKNKGCQIDKPIILLCPTSRWATKNWPLDRFIACSKVLSAKVGNRVIVIGASTEKDVARTLAKESGDELCCFIGDSALALDRLIALINVAHLCVTNDSGPMHLACAMNVPVVAIFGPTSELRTGPVCGNNRIVQSGVSCRPCFERTCPIKTHECMNNISVEQVNEACFEILDAVG